MLLLYESHNSSFSSREAAYFPGICTELAITILMPKASCQNFIWLGFGDCLKLAYFACGSSFSCSRSCSCFGDILVPPDFWPTSHHLMVMKHQTTGPISRIFEFRNIFRKNFFFRNILKLIFYTYIFFCWLETKPRSGLVYTQVATKRLITNWN